MRVLVACEFSGVVRDAFRERGHDAFSCDLKPTRGKYAEYHYRSDVRKVMTLRWDMMIAFPPCTYLSNANAFHGRQGGFEEDEALDFVIELMNAPISRIAIENPIGAINRRIRRSDQIIQPWMFGHPWKKQTHLWLKNLPPLKSSILRLQNSVSEFPSWTDQPGLNAETRAEIRSLTFPGIAQAMAEQWGN